MSVRAGPITDLQFQTETRPTYQIPPPPPVAFETKPVLKALAAAHRYLVELKGRAAAIPNQDELFQTAIFPVDQGSAAAREVALYRDAICRRSIRRIC